jgi:hypothetical protein
MEGAHVKDYEQPRIEDYGDLQSLTAGCLDAVGGDSLVPTGGKNGLSFGHHLSQPACTSA